MMGRISPSCSSTRGWGRVVVIAGTVPGIDRVAKGSACSQAKLFDVIFFFFFFARDSTQLLSSLCKCGWEHPHCKSCKVLPRELRLLTPELDFPVGLELTS